MQNHRRDQRPLQQNGWVAEIEPVAPVDLAGMLRIVWQGLWIVGLTLIFAVTIAGYYAFRLAQPQFAATATLALDPLPTSYTFSAAHSGPALSDDVRLNTAIAALTSRENLQRVIAALDLMSDPEFNRYLNPQPPYAPDSLRRTLRHFLAGTTEQVTTAEDIADKAADNLRGRLHVAAQPDTYILRITARSGSEDKAALLANTTAAQFTAAQRRTLADRAEATTRWLNNQLGDLERQLLAKEEEISGLIASAQLQDHAEIDALSIQVLHADQRLAQLDTELAALLERPDESNGRISAELAQKQAAVAATTALRARLSAQLSVQSSGLAQLHQLQRETEGIRAVYQNVLGRLHDARAQQELEAPVAQRITRATTAIYIGPQKILILTIAAMVGTITGLMLVAARHGMRQGVLDAVALRDATNTPVLAQFPKAANGRARQLRKHLRSDRQTGLTDAVRNLRTALLLTNHGRLPQIILSTSTLAGEGHSTHAIALAHALGHAGKSVLLIGADPADQTLLSVLSVRPHLNMRDVLAGTASVAAAVIRDKTLCADVLPSTQKDDQADVFLTDAFAAMLERLRQAYDHIIINAPPVNTAPHTLLLAQKADAVIYAVSRARTPLTQVKRGLRALDEADAPVTGLVLSNIHPRKLRQIGNGPIIGARGLPVPT